MISANVAVEPPFQLTSHFTSLAAVNFLLGCVGVVQVTRILMYQQSLKDTTLPEVARQDAKDEAEIAKGIAKNSEGAARKAGVK